MIIIFHLDIFPKQQEHFPAYLTEHDYHYYHFTYMVVIPL